MLTKLTDTPLDNDAFPWLTAQTIEAALAVDVYALRVNFVGSLGWELHFPIEYAHHLFDALFEAGAGHGIGMVGMRAMESLRMEKSYRMWGSDMTPDYTPFEASLDRFVRMKKGAFVGREALEKQLAAGVRNRFVTLEVHGVTDADPLGNEPLFDKSGRMIGRATSGYYGHSVQEEPGDRLRTGRVRRARHAAVDPDPRGDEAGNGAARVTLRPGQQRAARLADRPQPAARDHTTRLQRAVRAASHSRSRTPPPM